MKIASPPTSEWCGDPECTVVNMLKGTNVWLTNRIHADQEGSVEFKVPDGSVVTGFHTASIWVEACRTMRIEEVNSDGTIGAELYGWNYCGGKKRGGWLQSDHTPDFIAVATTATRFKVSVRHTLTGEHAQCAGLAIFRAEGICLL